jgi:hypothetical protein
VAAAGDRRWFIRLGGVAAGATMLASCKGPEAAQTARKPVNKRSERPKVAVTPSAQIRRDVLMRKLLKCPAPDVFEVVTNALRDGAERLEVWAAIGAALGTFDGDVHGRLALVSMYRLMLSLPVREQLLPMLWSADLLKREQAAGSESTKPTKVPAKIARLDSAQLIKRLHAAFAAMDTNVAAACALRLYTQSGQTLLREQLYICAAREGRFAGHGTMHTTQGLRWLDAMRWQNAEPTVVAIVRYLLPPATGQAAPSADDLNRYANERARSSKLATLLARGGKNKARKDGSLAITNAARAMTGGQLADFVADQVTAGASMQDAFTGLSLAAAELALNDDTGALRGVHGLDTVNALQVAATRAPTARTSALLLLMAAQRLPGFRTSNTASPVRPIDFEAPSSIDLQTAGYSLRTRVVHGHINDPHKLKYPVALLEQAAYAATWAKPILMRAADVCAPAANGPKWPRLQQAQVVIERLRAG